MPAPTESGALVPTTLTGEKDAAGVWHLTGTTTVKENVKPGKWSVLFSCAPGDVGVGEFTVVAETPAPQPTSPTQQPAEEQVAVKPQGAAEAGALEKEPTDTTPPCSASGRRHRPSAPAVILGHVNGGGQAGISPGSTS